MFGLEIATVGLLHLASISDSGVAMAKAEAIKKIKCQPTHDLDIKIAPTISSTQYDFSKATSELSVLGSGAYSPYGSEHKTSMLGLTDGRHELSLENSYSMETYPGLDRGCIHIKSITVKMNFSPTIYVASEFPKGTCEFKDVFSHEKEHVKITREMLNKHAKILGKNLKAALRRGYSYGPFHANKLPRAQKKLGEKVMKMAVDANKKMYAEMEKRQNKFDRQEKNRESLNQCANAKNSAVGR